MAKKRDHSDLSLVNGFVAGRLAHDDCEEGYSQPVPGCTWRIRVDLVGGYTQVEEGVLEVLTTLPDGQDSPLFFHVMGTVEGMDSVIARSRLKVAASNG